MEKKVFILGGSPCAGKSTVAERIKTEAHAVYFKADDWVEDCIEQAAKAGKPACKAYVKMKADEIWMRTPEEQCKGEFALYREIASELFRKIRKISAPVIITEGAAFTPEVMKQHPEYTHYAALIPSPAFHSEQYKKREWVKYVLMNCTDKDQAFANWMERDVLFANEVQQACTAADIPCIVNDGRLSVDEMYEQVKAALGV